MLEAIKALFRSRKFLLALVAAIQTIAAPHLGWPPETWVSINALVAVVIAGIAYEDGQEKSAPQQVQAQNIGTVNEEQKAPF